MTSRTAPVLRPLFVVLVVLTGAAPASATRAALPMEGTASLPAVLPPTNAVALHAEGSAAPAQRHMALRAAAADSGAVDPGDWDQGYPSVTGDSAGEAQAVTGCPASR
jgi:hypothetical protein